MLKIIQVSFSYPAAPELPVLRDLDCTFAGGQISFILGPSGCGKSTLAQLLARLYEPLNGSITVSGIPISSIPLPWIRKNITLVEQNSILFDGTIFENIALGRDDPNTLTFDHAKEAASFSLLASDIDFMPDGYDTAVGPQGDSLSGGQRQRVALARARIRDTPILILDESTSALDQTSRALIMLAVRKWRENKTTIVISHDSSMIEDQDIVYLLSEGHLIASGHRSVLDLKRMDLCSYFSLIHAATNSPLKQSNLFAMSDGMASSGPDRVIHSNQTIRRLSSMDEGFEDSPLPHPRYLPAIIGSVRIQDPAAFSPSIESNISSSCYHIPLESTGFSLPCSSLARRGLGRFQKIPDSPHSREFDSNNVSDLRFHADELYGVELLESSGSGSLHARAQFRNLLRAKTTEAAMEHGSLGTAVETSFPEAVNSAEPRSPKFTTMGSIISTIWPSLDSKLRLVLLSSSVCLLIHAAAVPLFSWLFSKMIETFYGHENASSLALKWSLAVLGLSTFDGLATYFLHVGMELCGQSWVDAFRLEAMRRILNQPMAFFGRRRNMPARLTYNLDRNAEEMRNILGRFMALFVSAGIMLTMAMVWSFAICWRLAFVAFTVMPVCWLLMRQFQIRSSGFESQSNDAGEVIAIKLSEAVIYNRTVKTLTLETFFRERHLRASNHALLIGVRKALYSGFFFGISEAAFSFASCLIYFYGSILVASHQCSIEDVITVFTQLIFAVGNVTAIMNLIPQIASSKDTSSRLLNLAMLSPGSHEDRGSHQAGLVDDIEFNDVSFSFAGGLEDSVLRNVSLTIEKAQITAIVGPSGCGKSTLASLLLRLYELPPSNLSRTSQIFLGGRSVDEISIQNLRSLITLVPQRPALFSLTIAENIGYGLPAKSRFNNALCIQSAASAAGIHTFIASLPEGYNTVVGDGGMGLSGGQAQKICIARALIRNPTVLVLDEATSGLDSTSVETIIQTLRTMRTENPDMVIVLITHDQRLMEIADRIFVVERGVVVEEGSFEELIRSSGGHLNVLLSGGVWKK